MSDFRSESPDFDPATMPPIPAEWSDLSWHNDACPSFGAGTEGDLETGGWRLYVFVDYADPKAREIRGLARFNVSIEIDDDTNGDHVFSSDDWDAVVAFAKDFDPKSLRSTHQQEV